MLTHRCNEVNINLRIFCKYLQVPISEPEYIAETARLEVVLVNLIEVLSDSVSPFTKRSYSVCGEPGMISATPTQKKGEEGAGLPLLFFRYRYGGARAGPGCGRTNPPAG